MLGVPQGSCPAAAWPEGPREAVDTVARVEPEALEREAASAIAGARTAAELDRARVRFLGRKSELKQALRRVRDRETGMALNALRERLERAVEERRPVLEAAERERVLGGGDGVDVTPPGER